MWWACLQCAGDTAMHLLRLWLSGTAAVGCTVGFLHGLRLDSAGLPTLVVADASSVWWLLVGR